MADGRRASVLGRAAVALTATAIAACTAECAARRIDGYHVLSLTLQPPRRPVPTTTAARPDRQYVDRIQVAAGVEPRWYEDSPPPIAPLPLPATIRARLARYPTDQIGALAVWNSEYLRQELCTGHGDGPVARLADFYTFTPPGPEPYPTYRHLPHVTPPGVFTSNAFGWRGPELTPQKPRNTIRLAFVGASTTSGDYSFAFSHPELVGHWLTRWAEARRLPYRFEIINAGRTGIDSSSIAAIVRQEVLPLEPDLVVFYEGSNDFEPMKELSVPHIPPKPAATFRRQTWAEDYSAIVRRALAALWLLQGGEGREPRKSVYEVLWPAGVDERDPDVTHRPLPMDLERVIANLDAMRAALAEAGSELAVSSFIWMVYDGMRVDLSRHLPLYRYLNDTYWPVTYAHMRRMADFQNRVFENYAKRYDLVFFDVATDTPRDPDLFSDAIHMTPDGLRLQAWIYLQRLVPVIESRLSSHRWPRPARASSSTDWATSDPPVMTRAEILASCKK